MALIKGIGDAIGGRVPRRFAASTVMQVPLAAWAAIAAGQGRQRCTQWCQSAVAFVPSLPRAGSSICLNRVDYYRETATAFGISLRLG